MTNQTRYDLELPGCTPEPLMAYLKALGILRLVSEQKDPDARGWWENDVFHLNSVLDPDALLKFFLDEYEPTRIVAPWNAGSGFYLKSDVGKKSFKKRGAWDDLSAIETSTSKRLKKYRKQIRVIKEFLARSAKRVDLAAKINDIHERGRRENWSTQKTKDEVEKFVDGRMFFRANGDTYAIQRADKDAFVREIRNGILDAEALRWFDAAFVLLTGQKKNRKEAPLLGSGGNIGNSELSARFMQVLASCIPLTDCTDPTKESKDWLKNALFGDTTRGLKKIKVDQFDPGRAGGANMHQGQEGPSRLNPWDYVLMVEGAVMFRGVASKRFGSTDPALLFPFSVDTTPVGFDSAGDGATRGEQWLPLWRRPCTCAEIEMLLAEGRAEIGSRPARTGVEFARAAASLGVDRGIKQFVRIQYQKRLGDQYLANALGRVDVVLRDSVDLLAKIDHWLDSLRGAVSSAAGRKETPPRIIGALRRIDSAIFDYCKYGGATFFQQIVIALGNAERELVIAEKFRQEKKIKPISGLSTEWFAAVDDHSREYAIARSLVSIHDPEDKVGPLRANLEPVDWDRKKRFYTWAEKDRKDRSVVWNAADLSTNLANVLQRRMMDAERFSCRDLPLASCVSVPLEHVASFIAGRVDDERIEQLLWGLMLITDPTQYAHYRQEADTSVHATLDTSTVLPREYALLKLLFLPRPLVQEHSGERIRWRLADGTTNEGLIIRPEPRILPLLRAGRVGEACRIAMQRLRSSGLRPMPGPLPSGNSRDNDWAERLVDQGTAQRLAAALLIPISPKSVDSLVHLVCRSDKSPADETITLST